MYCVDYRYYLTEYKGKMNEADFSSLSRRASAYLTALTHGKIDAQMWRDDVRAKDAICAMSDVINKYANGGNVSSESNDGASVSYDTSANIGEQRELYLIACTYLTSTGLLYRGAHYV